MQPFAELALPSPAAAELIGTTLIVGSPVAGIGSLDPDWSGHRRACWGGMYAILGIPFLLMLFLAIYVRSPHVLPAILRASKAMLDKG